jgi:hypothetical protein
VRILIQRDNGRTKALLLAASKQKMRVAVAGSGDSEEFTSIGGQWHDESGQTIELEALLPIVGVDCSAVCRDLAAHRYSRATQLELASCPPLRRPGLFAAGYICSRAMRRDIGVGYRNAWDREYGIASVAQ